VFTIELLPHGDSMGFAFGRDRNQRDHNRFFQ
jgi:hypothetical protein